LTFSTVRAPQAPALTVESLAISATGRPPTIAVPVMTPSAGSPSAAALAKMPSSARLPSSTSLAILSRANILPAAAAAAWYFWAPPAVILDLTSGRSSWLGLPDPGPGPVPGRVCASLTVESVPSRASDRPPWLPAAPVTGRPGGQADYSNRAASGDLNRHPSEYTEGIVNRAP